MFNEGLASAARYYKESKKGIETMCEILEEMKTEAAQKASIKMYIDTCEEFGIIDKNELLQRVLAKFEFLTEDEAKEYINA